MGTAIELTVSGVSLDYAKNHMGNDWGFLFQEGDLTRRRTEAINYDYYAEHPEEADELKVVEETLIRSLVRVLSRLNILGHTLETARAEYQAVISDFDSLDDGSGDEGSDKRDSMTFEEFCSLANCFPLDELSGAYVEFETPDRDIVAQGRFAALADEFSRIPWTDSQNMYWSEKSYLSDKVCILSAGSMLQVFGLNPANSTAEVEWEFGPIVHAGWVEREAIEPGARRAQAVLVATEGASDARILRKALDAFRPDVSDFFRFIDGDERHHFWGTGNLLKFAEGLIRIDIQNQVLFLLDNDAEGVDAFRKLQQMKMPGNLRSMALPDIEELRSFPALGPQGLALCDINGRAAAIECYLDLNLSDYPPARIIWSNYKKEIDAWHGALEHKDSYTRHFMTQDADSLVGGGYDSSKLVQLLDALIAEASRLLSVN
jgi:hypothetical protein